MHSVQVLKELSLISMYKILPINLDNSDMN